MFDYQRSKNLWNRSDSRYRLRTEEKQGKQSESFDRGQKRESDTNIPHSMAYLENAYGMIEFASSDKGEVLAAFRKKKAFQEPTLSGEKKKINLDLAKTKPAAVETEIFNSHEKQEGAAAYRFPGSTAVHKYTQRLEDRFGNESDAMIRALMPDKESGPTENREQLKEHLRQGAKHSFQTMVEREKKKNKDYLMAGKKKATHQPEVDDGEQVEE